MTSSLPIQLPKTRVIPITDFFTRLQLECISYRFRSLIYQRPYDIKKFAEIAIKKKEKIDQIALENCLPSIFNNEKQREKYLLKFFPEWGMPDFAYRDDYQTKVKGYWDVHYYYVIGASVRIRVGEEVVLGKIKSCDIAGRSVIVFSSEEEYDHQRSFNETSRIFPSTFYHDFFLV